MTRVVNGMHVSNGRHWDIEQMLRIAQPDGAVTILHHLMFERDELADQWGDVENAYWFVKLRDGWEPQGIPPAPERLIHVRMFHSNWCSLDPTVWAEHTVKKLGDVRCPMPDGSIRRYNLWQDPFVAVSAANEQNLHYECGDPDPARQPLYQTTAHYERIADWNLRFWQRIDELVPNRKALATWSALAQGHDPDHADIPDGEYQIPAIREAIGYCDLLATHPYARLDWPDGEKTAPGGADEYWHMLRDFRPEGWRDAITEGRPHDPGGALAQFPDKLNVITESGAFTHDDEARTAETLAAMRALLERSAASGRVLGVTWFIWNSDSVHGGNRIWENERLRRRLEYLERFEVDVDVPVVGDGKVEGGMKQVNLVGQLPTDGTYSRRKLTDINEVVLHHSVGYIEDERQLVENIARSHVQRGWPGIGYHRCVGRDGTIYLTNELEAISYHARGVANPISIGVCLLGDYRYWAVNEAQIEALVAQIVRLNKVISDATNGRIECLDIKPHSFYVNTICPGDNVRAVIPTLKARTDTPAQSEARELYEEIRDTAAALMDKVSRLGEFID